MAPPKKMTLQEFFSDESYGGSWADDDIDMASISVPIERPSHFHSLYSGDSFYSGGPGNFSRGGGHDPGPPYIAKMVNLPVTASDSFIEDLFKSRYTTFVKFKIVVDPSSNILETHIIKKVAFVELESFGDLQKVLKWVDLYYKANRKVIVEQADFGDFQNCINFNKTKAQEIDKIQQEFLSNKQFGHGFPDHEDGPHTRHAFPRSPLRSHQPLHSTPPLRRPSFGTNHLSNAPPLVAPKNKSNPFGTAKPVDVLSKQQEIEKKLINLNGTTAQTLGPDGEPGDVETTIKKFHEAANPRRNSFNTTRRASQSTPRRPSVSILKRISVPDIPKEEEPPKSPLSSVPPPPSVYGTNGSGGGRSLAELLSAKPTDFKESTPGARNSPATTKAPIVKPQVNKAVVLKKKIPSPPLTKAELVTVPKVQEEKETFGKVSKEKEREIEDKLNKINESLSHSDFLENTTETTTPTLSGASTTTSLPPKTVKNGKKEPPSAKVENGTTDKAPARPFDDDRPDFKKHLNELVKKPYVPKEKRPHQPNSNFRGNYLNVGRRNYNNNNNNTSHIQSSGDPTDKRSDSTDRRPTPSQSEAGNGDEKFRPKTQNNPRNQTNLRNQSNTRGRSRSPTKSKNKANSKIIRGPNSSNSSLPEPVSDISKTPISDIQQNGKQNEKRKETVKEAKGNVETISLQPKAVREDDSTRLETERSENHNSTDSSPSTRGRGRGGARGRGSSRGKRGRGRGGTTNSFNLHYVRPKPTRESKPEPSPSLQHLE